MPATPKQHPDESLIEKLSRSDQETIGIMAAIIHAGRIMATGVNGEQPPSAVESAKEAGVLFQLCGACIEIDQTLTFGQRVGKLADVLLRRPAPDLEKWLNEEAAKS